MVSPSGPGPNLGRRAVLAALGCAIAEVGANPAQAASPSEPPLTILDLDVGGFRPGFGKVRVLVPHPARTGSRSRAVVLLHGLGETHQLASALIAWSDLYGARKADARLSTPPWVPPQRNSLWSDALLGAFNAELAVTPYLGAVLVCPRTPNPRLEGDRSRLFDEYASWLCDGVLPAVERQVPASTRHVGLDGCSLGGYVAVEVLLGRQAHFAAAGCVQAALGQSRVARYAQQLTAVLGARPDFRFRLASSLGDPYLELNRNLSRRLHDQGLKHELDVVPGPHNQPWLCEIGTPRLLRWYDLTLGRPRSVSR